MKRPFVILAFLLALGGGAYIYRSHAPQPGGMMGMPPQGPVPVRIEEVVVREVDVWSEFSGRLAAVEEAAIRPRVGGIVEGVHFKDGGLVAKGDLLFTIDAAPYKAEVAKAEGQLASARASLAMAKPEFARGESMIKDHAISLRDFEQRKNTLLAAEAAVKSAEAAVTRARLDLSYTEIRAPISGRAGRAELTIGNLVGAGADAPVLTTVVSASPVYADFDMDEATFLRYAGGTGANNFTIIPITLSLAGEGESTPPRTGRIHSFDNRLDGKSGTLRVRAVFDNADGALVPGLFARVRMASAGKTRAVLVDDRAVATDQDKKFVYVVGAGNKAEYRAVTLGPMAEGLRIVTNGLQAGEKIVTGGLQRVRPGQEVTPAPAAPASGPEGAPAP